MTARGAARTATPAPGWIVNPFKAISAGSPDAVRLARFLRDAGKGVDDVVLRFEKADLRELKIWLAEQVQLATPTASLTAKQIALWATGTATTWGSNAQVLPKFG
ncbi:hypothetical protein GCM10027056_11900 [Glaciibacter psychrotolerans]